MVKLRYLIFFFISHSLYGLTTLHVSVNTDDNPGGFGDPGDLRYCLNTMNNQLNNDGPEDYAIVFDMPMTIQLNGILPIINNSSNVVNITIGNSGSTPTVTIDGNSGTYPGFFIPMGNVTIQNINFQNLIAKGGDGGAGISGGGGGMGAGGAIYAPRTFLNGSYPEITLINVQINNCSAVGGNGGSYLSGTPTGNEGGGGGGGFGGNGGSVTVMGTTGGGGGGGFGGNGGNATLSLFGDGITPLLGADYGGGGGGGGGIGSRATMGSLGNLGNGGSDQDDGQPGNGYGLSTVAGTGAGYHVGGNRAGGAGGGGGESSFGGGGGGSAGFDGRQSVAFTPPGGSASPSGGNGGDGGGGGGGGVCLLADYSNNVDGAAGGGGYGGGGGGASGVGAYDVGYSIKGGDGGTGGGGGGGGGSTGMLLATGGDSGGGGGGGGGGPSEGTAASGGTDAGSLGGGAGGSGADAVGVSYGGGGGGGGSGLGGAIFIDSGLVVTIKAFTSIPTTFNTPSCTAQGGTRGAGGPNAQDGFDGSALGNSIFMRSGSSLTFEATDPDDLLTLGEDVSFVDDTSFGGGPTLISVTGKGMVVYNGSSDYQGIVQINNANFKVNGVINQAEIKVCRNISISTQRGTLSGSGSLTGLVFANSGTISPDAGETLTVGSLQLNPADSDSGTLGSLVHITIDGDGTSLLSVTGAASLAGILEIDLDPSAEPGAYTVLTSAGITGTFDSVTFTGTTPNYSLSYLPVGSPTYVQFTFLGFLEPASHFQGVQKKNNFGLEYELYNQLTWTASSSSQTVGYFVYRDGDKIATLGASDLSYQDHNRPRGVTFIYSLIAFDSDGNTSSSVTVTVPGI